MKNLYTLYYLHRLNTVVNLGMLGKISSYPTYPIAVILKMAMHLEDPERTGWRRHPRLVLGWLSPDRLLLGHDDAPLARVVHGCLCWVGVGAERTESPPRPPQDPNVLPSRAACRRGTRIGHRVLWRRGGLRPQSLHLAAINKHRFASSGEPTPLLWPAATSGTDKGRESFY